MEQTMKRLVPDDADIALDLHGYHPDDICGEPLPTISPLASHCAAIPCA